MNPTTQTTVFKAVKVSIAVTLVCVFVAMYLQHIQALGEIIGNTGQLPQGCNRVLVSQEVCKQLMLVARVMCQLPNGLSA